MRTIKVYKQKHKPWNVLQSTLGCSNGKNNKNEISLCRLKFCWNGCGLFLLRSLEIWR